MDLFAGLPQRPAHAPAVDEGPLAHEARVSAETTYLDGLSDVHRRAWEQASGARPESWCPNACWWRRRTRSSGR